MRKENTTLAIVFSLGASLTYAVLAFLVKYAEQFLPNAVLIFFRQLFGLLFLMPIIPIRLGSIKALKTKVFPYHLLRTFASLSSMFCLYYALRYLPLTDAVLLSYTRPLFIPIIVYFWFNYKWTKDTYLGLIIGFLGIVMILNVKTISFNAASLGALAAAFLGAIAFTTIRHLTKTDPPERITFYYVALSLPLALFPLRTNWQMPNFHGWVLLMILGALALFYQLLLSRAYRYAKAVKVGSLLYFSVFFAYLIDIFNGKKTFSISVVVGIILIILGSVITLKGQRKIR